MIDNVIHAQPANNPVLAWLLDHLGGAAYLQRNLWIGAAAILAINALICVCVFLRGYWNAVISEEVCRKVRNRLYAHLQSLPFSYHVRIKTGDLVQRCTSDVDQIRRFLAGQISEVVYSVATALAALLILFSIYRPLAWLAVISMPLLVIYAYVFFTRVQKAFLASDEAEGDLSTAVQENLSGIRVVKAFNNEREEIRKFEQKNARYRDLTFKMIQYLGAYWGTSDLICLTQIFVIILAGIFAAVRGDLSVGSFFVFISYEGMILWPVRNLGRILADMGKMSVSIGRLQEILDETPEDVASGETPPIEGRIEFDHVQFQYEGDSQPVLKDLTFTIEKGMTVALIGPTGGGKSTLVHLLMRLYDPTSGQIRIDGHDITDIQRTWLRQNIGIVLQEPFLFSKTIYDNIHLARRGAHREEVEQAARIASVHEVIAEFDRGYDTLVGEKGVTLSGGQKQRIAIARTVLSPQPILIFDDSLSAVDTQTDAKIRAALKEVQSQTTTLIITQRVASAMDADLILVLEQGRITQAGTHDQLLEEEGLYRRIVEIQTARMNEGGEEA
ncbi:MAG: ABC transporter ATP-binding protein [Holdemania filiformis]